MLDVTRKTDTLRRATWRQSGCWNVRNICLRRWENEKEKIRKIRSFEEDQSPEKENRAFFIRIKDKERRFAFRAKYSKKGTFLLSCSCGWWFFCESCFVSASRFDISLFDSLYNCLHNETIPLSTARRRSSEKRENEGTRRESLDCEFLCKSLDFFFLFSPTQPKEPGVKQRIVLRVAKSARSTSMGEQKDVQVLPAKQCESSFLTKYFTAQWDVPRARQLSQTKIYQAWLRTALSTEKWILQITPFVTISIPPLHLPTSNERMENPETQSIGKTIASFLNRSRRDDTNERYGDEISRRWILSKNDRGKKERKKNAASV